jgi:hypothetical protein
MGGPEPVEPEADQRPLGMPPAGQPAPPPQPASPDPDTFTREILRGLEP